MTTDLTALESSSPSADDQVCERCHGAGWLWDPDAEDKLVCECQASTVSRLQAQQAIRLLAAAGMGKKLERMTLDSVEVNHPDTKTMLEAVDRWVSSHLAMDGKALPWLFLMGDRGAGKTHMAAAAVRMFAERLREVVYWDYLDLMDELRAGYRFEKADSVGEDGYDRILREAKRGQVLVLDDILKGKSSAWTIEQLDKIIDYRWRQEAPTLITTNVGLEALEKIVPRAASRLMDAAICEVVLTSAPDYRLKNRRR